MNVGVVSVARIGRMTDIVEESYMSSELHRFLVTLVVLLVAATVAAGEGRSPAAGRSALLGVVTVELPLQGVSLRRGPGGRAVFAGAPFGGHAGRPALPVRELTLLLPPNADIGSVKARIKNPVVTTMDDTWDVAPVPLSAIGGQVLPEGRRIVAGRDVAAYATDAYLPGSFLGRVSSGCIREWRLAHVEVFPYRYNPASRRLQRLSSGRLVVTYGRAGTAGTARTRAAALAERVRARVRRKSCNFSAAALWYDETQGEQGGVSTPGYVILTTSAIEGASTSLASFVAAREAGGFEVTVVTEATWGGGTGDAAAENIRAWLQSNYQSQSIEYVLFIGNPNPDSGDVPMKMCWPRNNATTYTQYKESPSDYYYADLTGNWDLDGDGKYGEYDDDGGAGGWDRDYEVIVGRIPCYGSMPDLDAILTKIVQYPNSPMAWRKKALMAVYPADGSTPGYHPMEEIKDQVLIPKGDWQWHRVYNEDYGLTPPPETTPCSVTNVTNTWNGSQFGAVFWFTHGSSTSASNVMDVSHAATLSDSHPAFIYQSSCYNGKPETTNNLAYSLLKNGAVATVGATRVSWYALGQTSCSGTATNQGMLVEYGRRLIAEEMPAGQALQDMKMDINPSWWGGSQWMNYLDYNLYGCPAVGVYTVAPEPPALYVQSTPIDGVEIIGDPVAAGGVTDYQVLLPAGTQVAMTAPETFSDGSDEYTFVNWVLNGTPRTAGHTVLTFVLNEESTAVAEYRLSGEGRKGDFDLDGDVDFWDLMEFADVYGLSKGDPGWDPNGPIGDFDDDDTVGFWDMMEFAGVYGT